MSLLATGSDAWVRAGWTMLHYLWAGTLLGLAASTCRLGLRRAGANVRYLVALGWLALLAVCPIAIALWIDEARTPEIPGSRWAAPTFTSANRHAEPTPSLDPSVPIAPEGEQTGRLFLAPSWTWDGLVTVLPWIWVFGAPLTLAWSMMGLAGAERLRRLSSPTADRTTEDLCRRVARSLGIARRVSIRLCERIAAPVLVGIVRPLILLPPSLLCGLAPEQIELLLLHELAHVRRWDNLVNLLQRVVESLLFFHPAVWLVSRWVRLEREHCCDELVIRRTGRRESYAETLLAVVRRGLAAGRTRLAVGAVAGSTISSALHKGLGSRIRRILGQEEETMQVSRKLGAVVPIALLTAVVAVGTFGLVSSGAEPPATSHRGAAAGAAVAAEPAQKGHAKQEDNAKDLAAGAAGEHRASEPVVAHGAIRWVNRRLGVVWIDLGRLDDLAVGTTFQVYSPGEKGGVVPGRKGLVVVTRILGDHLAEGHVVQQRASAPIMPRDRVFSPDWDRKPRPPEPDLVPPTTVALDTLAELRLEVQNLRKELRAAQEERDKRFSQLVEVTEQLHKLRNEQAQLTAELQALHTARDRLAQELDRLRLDQTIRDSLKRVYSATEEKEGPFGSSPRLEGIVQAVSGKDLVEISLGSDDGVRKGQTLEVYGPRGASLAYVGRVEVVQTSPDRSICRIMSKSLQGPVQKGDRVATKLPAKVDKTSRARNVTIDAEGRIAVDGTPVTLEQLPTALAGPVGTGAQLSVLIGAHPNANQKRVVEVLQACQKAGVVCVGVNVHTEDEED